MQLGDPHSLTREERLRKPLTYEDAMAIKEQCPSVETVSVELFREMGDFGLPPVTAKYKGQEMIDAIFSASPPNHLRLSTPRSATAASSPTSTTCTGATWR